MEVSPPGVVSTKAAVLREPLKEFKIIQEINAGKVFLFCGIIAHNILYVCRNYHVFYYLLAGASEEERKSFHLLKPEEYHYLNQVCTHTHTHSTAK